jgi:hypothetical protein
VVRDRGQRGPITLGLRALGSWRVAARHHARAARTFGAEAAGRSNASIESMSPPFLAVRLASSYTRDLAAARAGLDAGAFAAAWAAGEAMSLAVAVADALSDEAE